MLAAAPTGSAVGLVAEALSAAASAVQPAHGLGKGDVRWRTIQCEAGQWPEFS